MRATWLFWPCLAALALAVPTGCHRTTHRAEARAKAVKVAVGPNVQVAIGKAGVRVAVAPVAAVPAPPELPEDKTVASWEVKGWGRNQAEAEQNALKKAHQLVAAHLRHQEPPFAWVPSEAYVRKYLVAGRAKRLKDEDQPVAAIQTECWGLTIRLTASQYRTMVKQDRIYRVRQREADREWRAASRMLLAGKVTLGLLILLMGVSGYILLDGRAGGAYSKGLRAGLGRVVTAPASGLRVLAGSKCKRGGPGS